MKNLLLLSDSYKVTHWKQYPPNTRTIYSYFESRGGRFKKTLFFGLQYLLKEYLVKGITRDMIEEAEGYFTPHFGTDKLFNKAGWLNLLNKHNGKLPVKIKAVPEGTRVPVSNVLMTIENTDPEFYWLTNYLETLLVQTWYPTTVATQSYEIKQIIKKYLEKTGSVEGLPFKLHDFGFRGVSSVESGGIGGLAHLVNFMGTDTLNAIVFARKYYDCNMAAYSIPASEHSTITSWGKDNEYKAFENMLTKYSDCPLVACVSDSYDIYKACASYWGDKLKNQVLNRKGILIIRPDSGDPETVVLKVLEILFNRFKGTINDKGYKVLNKHVRIIQGDGVNFESINQILKAVIKHGFSADNIAFGMGGALLQRLDRDTQEFAFKCSSININGEEIDVYKDPITAKSKISKAGRLKLVQYDGFMRTKREEHHDKDLLRTVFENGEIKKTYTLNEVRNLTTYEDGAK